MSAAAEEHPYPVAPRRGGDPVARRLAAQKAANARWSRVDDRVAETQAMRDGLQRKFEDEVDPDRRLDPKERERRAASARRAHMNGMTAKSRKTTKKKSA